MENINRICVIGFPGTGKTTLSKKLKDIYHLPVCHLDSIHHLPNWELREESERDALILEETIKDKWILDGNYLKTLSQRVNRADMVIFLDYSTISALKGVITRVIRNHGKEKADIPGCKEKFDLNFILFVASYRKERRQIILDILEKCDKEKIMIFKNRKKLEKWLKTVQN